jgi:hypothetical protein
MIKNELVMKHPLGFLRRSNGEILPEGGFGAVMARAGVGKTAFIVQVAINSLLRDQKVLHIALKDTVKKVVVWYEEVFRNMTEAYRLEDSETVWETALRNRFIMTFQMEEFSVPKLRERMTDLSEQGIFTPQVLLIDGFPFAASIRGMLENLKAFSRQKGLKVWFTVTTHRHEPDASDGYPAVFSPVADFFEAAIQLVPEGKEVLIRAHKGSDETTDQTDLRLNPSTLLICSAAE